MSNSTVLQFQMHGSFKIKSWLLGLCFVLSPAGNLHLHLWYTPASTDTKYLIRIPLLNTLLHLQCLHYENQKIVLNFQLYWLFKNWSEVRLNICWKDMPKQQKYAELYGIPALTHVCDLLSILCDTLLYILNDFLSIMLNSLIHLSLTYVNLQKVLDLWIPELLAVQTETVGTVYTS